LPDNQKKTRSESKPDENNVRQKRKEPKTKPTGTITPEGKELYEKHKNMNYIEMRFMKKANSINQKKRFKRRKKVST
jgi:hypothetical protein